MHTSPWVFCTPHTCSLFISNAQTSSAPQIRTPWRTTRWRTSDKASSERKTISPVRSQQLCTSVATSKPPKRDCIVSRSSIKWLTNPASASAFWAVRRGSSSASCKHSCKLPSGTMPISRAWSPISSFQHFWEKRINCAPSGEWPWRVMATTLPRCGPI